LEPRYFQSVSGDKKHKNLTKTTTVSHCIGVLVQTPAAMWIAFSPVFISESEQCQNILKYVKQECSFGEGGGGVDKSVHQSPKDSKPGYKMNILKLKNLISSAQNIPNFWGEYEKIE
jgi:hypothetical protein